jgi:hypothetical protein
MRPILVVGFALLSRSVSAEILDDKRLSKAIQDLPNTKLDRAAADRLVSSAMDAAGDDLDPVALLAQQYIESRFDPTAVSRLIGDARQTGAWRSMRAPFGWTGNLYCGIAQTAATTWRACLALRDLRPAMLAQAAELRTWLKRTRGDMPLALAGYGCGNHGVTTGRCNGYPSRIRRLAARLRKIARVGPMS